MVDVLLILDGASEPLGATRTSLERAATPALDALAAEGTLRRLRTVPPGLPAGSETAIPGLLGWVPPAPVDRGAIEAAAFGLDLAQADRARRVDRRDRADAARSAAGLAARLPGHCVHHLTGHRMLLVGPDPVPALPSELLVWPAGVIPPRMLDDDVLVIGARGAAVGIARLMGARTQVPPGASGLPGSDLAAKAGAALAAIADGARRVVVHVGGADEAAHQRDAAMKSATIEAADLLLIGPLASAVSRDGGRLRVCPDHGCDPASGAHDALPVPLLAWPADHDGPPARHAGASRRRLTERAVAALPVLEMPAAIFSAGERRCGRAVAA